jgi:radical SAM protein with 4Fe4S-binding SPASM domain
MAPYGALLSLVEGRLRLRRGVDEVDLTVVNRSRSENGRSRGVELVDLSRGADDPLAAGAEAHYDQALGPLEYPELPECPMMIENIGWTLGNDCPYRCTHCYSMSARRKSANLERWMVDRIVEQLTALQVKTVNLGGNEPIFTNGLALRASLLPYIIASLDEVGIVVGLTTSATTLLKLESHFSDVIPLLNDIDVSLDSPFEDEHNANRGASLYHQAIKALDLCTSYGIDHTIIMCAMAWNFTPRHIDGLLSIAKAHAAHIRINPLKPVERQHMQALPDARAFYAGFSRLMGACEQVDLGEPLLATATAHPGHGCPCGRTSFRIHSITPDGRVPVSPCVYLHEYKVGNLLVDDLQDIVRSPQFASFRRRNANPHLIDGCAGCTMIETCRGGCAARSYLHELHERGTRSLFVKDPYCLSDARAAAGRQFPHFPHRPHVPQDKVMVHRDYLCTWIGEPRE